MSLLLNNNQRKFKGVAENVQSAFVSSINSISPLIDYKLILLCGLWYFTSVVSSNSTKSILKNFKFPVTLTELQFLMNGFLCLILLYSIRNYDFYHSKSNKKFNPNSLYNNYNYKNFIDYFPKGTFPKNLNNLNYSILNEFLIPNKFVIMTTLPMGIFQFIGHIASHKATSIIPVSLVHTIKALSPLTTVLIYKMMFKVNFNLKTYLTLIPLITGVMLSCLKNNLTINDDLFYTGCLFAFISMLIFVSQNIFAKRILTFEAIQSNKSNEKNDFSDNDNINNDNTNNQDAPPSFDFSKLNSLANNLKIVRSESATTTPILPISMTPVGLSPPITPLSGSSTDLTSGNMYNSNNNNSNGESNSTSSSSVEEEKKLDKITVLFYCSLVGFCLTLPFYIISELTNSEFSLSLLNYDLYSLLLLNGISHFFQSLIAFQILGMISPINYSIANILKRIVVISCSIILEGTKLNSYQWLGLVLTFVGLYCYDKWGVDRSGKYKNRK
ncbi:hypothetical protein B5S31_g707 [[Candida] boidinii]|nr:hypothetical protein B5S29_g1549 [[Candida] boidinii]OWB71025.1 hypothetical protein B5S31_g707 [[Candida] boidinii]OWB77447.1 hypothetical protein B5S32_g1612 [[Candida] boidinii]GME96904.1 unnamed protein product [[Candida] boidinii]